MGERGGRSDKKAETVCAALSMAARWEQRIPRIHQHSELLFHSGRAGKREHISCPTKPVRTATAVL